MRISLHAHAFGREVTPSREHASSLALRHSHQPAVRDLLKIIVRSRNLLVPAELIWMHCNESRSILHVCMQSFLKRKTVDKVSKQLRLFLEAAGAANGTKSP